MAWELADNIRGPKGDKGDTGTISSVSVATLPAGAPAEVKMTGTTDVHVDFKIPKGDKGDQGVPGTLSSASAESVPAGESAEVIMSGTTEVKHAHFKVPRGLPGLNGVENDEAFATYIAAEDSATRRQLMAAFEGGTAKKVYVSSDGNDALFSGRTSSSPKKTIAAALQAMGPGVKGTIVLGFGDIDAGPGLNWAGYQCGMIGQGSANTRIVSTTQNGPIIDLSAAGYALQDTTWGGFTLYGDGVPNRANKGIALDPGVSMVNARFYDIVARNTGGTPFDLGYAELCVFDQLYAFEPTGAVSLDVPYISGRGAFNGNTFRDCVVHGLSAGASVGVSGAVVIRDNGSTSPHANNFDTMKFEYLHLPEGGTIFNLAGNDNEINHPQYFDCSKVAGATGTSYFRLDAPPVMNSGGNKILGVIPGKGTNATDIDTGVEIRQNRNTVVGVKGFRGANVTLHAGVGDCYCELHGAVAAAQAAAFVDNSGVSTNILIDHFQNVEKRPARTVTQGSSSTVVDHPGGAWGPGGVRFSDPATPANGILGLGTTGMRLQALGAAALGTADAWTFRTLALTNLFGIVSSDVRGVRLYNSGTLPTATSAHRGIIAFAEGGSGAADRLVVCRKDAAGAYAWVDLF